MYTPPLIPNIPEEELTPLVRHLLLVIQGMSEQLQRSSVEIRALKDEIAKLKNQKPRPKISPSSLNKNSQEGKETSPTDGKRPGSAKRKKTAELNIDEERLIVAENVPANSRFKGYSTFTVQNLVIRSHVIRYKLEHWIAPGGKSIHAELPAHIRGQHFGPELRSYCIYQHTHNRVTQYRLLQQLWDWDIDISEGQLNNILTEGKGEFHSEKMDILEAGLEVSNYINVDDTGARHKGKNGYCTHIGNSLFAYFQSTESKSRINFLETLRGRHKDYAINEEALWFMHQHGAIDDLLNILERSKSRIFKDKKAWLKHLKRLGVKSEKEIQIATEGALVGSLMEHGFRKDMVIVSDAAGQFDILLHALCWLHAERPLKKLIPAHEQVRVEVESLRNKIWLLYKDLQAYKERPEPGRKEELTRKFDTVFSGTITSPELEKILAGFRANKGDLLRVLDHPEIPLHNNASESDIREYVTKRKISGTTRSDEGRKCRDTFISLMKTCIKLGLSFWSYLVDREKKEGKIDNLGNVIRQVAQSECLHHA